MPSIVTCVNRPTRNVGLPFGMEMQRIQNHRDTEERRQNAAGGGYGEGPQQIIEHQLRVGAQIAQARRQIAAEQNRERSREARPSAGSKAAKRRSFRGRLFKPGAQRPHLGAMQSAFAALSQMHRHASRSFPRVFRGVIPQRTPNGIAIQFVDHSRSIIFTSPIIWQSLGPIAAMAPDRAGSQDFAQGFPAPYNPRLHRADRNLAGSRQSRRNSCPRFPAGRVRRGTPD